MFIHAAMMPDARPKCVQSVLDGFWTLRCETVRDKGVRHMSASRRAPLAPLIVSAAFAFVMNACTPPAGTGGGPLPSATPTPAPTPPGTLAVNPKSLSFVGTGATLATTFTASETGYTGAFTESDTCSGIATVAAGAAGSYTITPSGAGSCTVTIADSFAQKAAVAVSVTTSGAVVQ
jgi:hypothetical protein